MRLRTCPWASTFMMTGDVYGWIYLIVDAY